MSTTLVRTPVVVKTPDEQFDECYAAFANECSERLGYHKLIQKKKSRPVAEALARLKIEPYSTKSVEKYKRRKAFKETLKHPAPILVTLGITLLLGYMIGGPILSIIFWCYGATCLGIAAGWYIPITFFTGLFALAAFGNITQSSHAYDISWKEYKLSQYDGFVPEFALQTALDLKKECGDAVGFYVEELIVVKRKRDPFLMAHDIATHECFYLEVWNEPKFKKALK